MSESNQVCGLCLEDNEENEGVVYCSECKKALCIECKQEHTKYKATKRHELCDIADVPSRDIQDLLKSLIACPNHDNKKVVYLCKDHDVTCCSKCAMADHRQCKDLHILSDILHDIQGDGSELKTVLSELKQQGEDLLKHERKHEELISETEKRALMMLENTKQKLMGMYEELKNELLSDIAERKKLIGEQMQAQNEKLRQCLQDIEQQSYFFEGVDKFGTAEQVVLFQRQLKRDSVCRLKSTAVKLNDNRSKSMFQCTVHSRFDNWLTEIRNSVQIEDLYCSALEETPYIEIRKTPQLMHMDR